MKITHKQVPGGGLAHRQDLSKREFLFANKACCLCDYSTSGSLMFITHTCVDQADGELSNIKLHRGGRLNVKALRVHDCVFYVIVPHYIVQLVSQSFCTINTQ